MYKAFNETLLTDMGRYKVRMHLRTTDAQAVSKEYSEYMTTAYKGASEERKPTQYVTNTVLPYASGPGHSRILIKGLLQLEGRKIISLTQNPETSNFFYRCWYNNPMLDQRLVAARGEEDHQPHPKTMEYPTSSMDNGKPTKLDIPTVFIKSRHDDGPTSSRPLPEFNPDNLIRRTFLLPPGDKGRE